MKIERGEIPSEMRFRSSRSPLADTITVMGTADILKFIIALAILPRRMRGDLRDKCPAWGHDIDLRAAGVTQRGQIWVGIGELVKRK